MALPKAVREIGEAAEAAAVAAGIKPGSQPEAKPVAQAVAEVVHSDPAPSQSRVDPDDYKERFSRYKAQTDKTIAELRQMVASTQATLAEVQRMNQELMQRQQAAPAAQEESAEPNFNDPAYLAWKARLPARRRDEYEESFLYDQWLFNTASRGDSQDTNAPVPSEFQEKVDRVIEYQEKTETQLFEEKLDKAFPNDGWINLTKEPEWTDFWNTRVSPVDRRNWADVVTEGNKRHDADAIIWALKQFEQFKTTLNPAVDQAPNPMEDLVTPGDAGGGSNPIDTISAQAETFKHSEVMQFFTDVATTKKYTAEQAAAIEQKIIAAQKAGKIIPG